MKDGDLEYMYWDCPACGTKGIRGDHLECTSCGEPRDEKVEFYFKENEPVITDEQEKKDALAGPDKVCPFCETDNPAGRTTCIHCGGSLDGSKRLEVHEYAPGEEPYAPPPVTHHTPPPVSDDRSDRLSTRESYSALSGLPWGMIGIILGVVALISLLSFFIIKGVRTSDVTVTVTSFSWERSIVLEHTETVHDQGWTVPVDAYNVTSYSKFYGTDQVIDHYETKHHTVSTQVKVGEKDVNCRKVSNGNGTGSTKCDKEPIYQSVSHDETYQDPVYRSVDVYKPWYSYSQDVVKTRTVPSSGQGKDPAPYWPTPTLNPGEREQVNNRHETYTVVVKQPDGHDNHFTASQEEWTRYQTGQKLVVKMNGYNAIVSVNK